jgi:hypothetical protein
MKKAKLGLGDPSGMISQLFDDATLAGDSGQNVSGMGIPEGIPGGGLSAVRNRGFPFQ